MKFRFESISDKGNYRQTNQDYIYVNKIKTRCGQALMAVLCDGMGGMSYGEYASRAVVNAFRDWFNDEFAYIISLDFIKETVINAWNSIISQVNTDIYETAENLCVQIGTTVTVILVIDGIYYCFHIGDTRMYGVTNTEAIRITTDHTVVAHQLAEGSISSEEASISPQRHILTRCVGGENTVLADFYMGKIDGFRYFVLCSDGFYDGMSESDVFLLVKEMTEKRGISHTSLQKIVDKRRKKGEKDNISIIIVEIR